MKDDAKASQSMWKKVLTANKLSTIVQHAYR